MLFVPLLMLLRVPFLECAPLVLFAQLLLQLQLGVLVMLTLLCCGGRTIRRVLRPHIAPDTPRIVARIVRVIGVILVEGLLLALARRRRFVRHVRYSFMGRLSHILGELLVSPLLGGAALAKNSYPGRRQYPFPHSAGLTESLSAFATAICTARCSCGVFGLPLTIETRGETSTSSPAFTASNFSSSRAETSSLV